MLNAAFRLFITTSSLDFVGAAGGQCASPTLCSVQQYWQSQPFKYHASPQKIMIDLKTDDLKEIGRGGPVICVLVFELFRVHLDRVFKHFSVTVMSRILLLFLNESRENPVIT